jgi:hypothetical protein
MSKTEAIALSELTAPMLLCLQAETMEELRRRGVVRSTNNPTGDLAEYLFCKAFGWTQANNSHRHVDAIGTDGTRYQIKGRRVTKHNASRQLSAIRDLADGNFDYLAGVVFSSDYTVHRAAIIPHAVIALNSEYVKRTNSHRFMLRDAIWNQGGVLDVTENLRQVKF